MYTGKHLIAGQWLDGAETFQSSPATGPSRTFAVGDVKEVNVAAQAAEQAFAQFSQTSRAQRAEFLRAIGEEIESRAEAITEIGCQETALPEGRLNMERGRTVNQLRMFADHIEQGDYLDRRLDKALPDRQPLPRPDLRLMQRPIGPVAVFGASNFPLAFSVAGGDTAAALAAGCPVVVKGHSAHPGTGEIVAQAIAAAVERCAMPAGVFSFVQGGNRAAGAALVQHPLINAVGFTGSLSGGRALFDLCAQRPEPIPFFGELGSVNPMFILPAAMSEKAEEIGAGWAGSLTMGVGQFCTNPGIAVVIEGARADAFIESTVKQLQQVDKQTMLTDGIASAYQQGATAIASIDGVTPLLEPQSEQRDVSPAIYQTSADNWLSSDALAEEVFGPLGLVVVAKDVNQMLVVANKLQGQLTCAVHLNTDDTALAAELLPILERKAGRVLANAFPTGVEVCDTMVHGGPYPASTNFGATSVGTMSIRRFLRPVCYQGIAPELLPKDLQ